ncbi:MAG TPA: type II secretion system protein, partial [Candidatus Colwellbacteria bacterium]|nr:type II secretion system protein [Candidatus Colwellbacteria bacterium]
MLNIKKGDLSFKNAAGRILKAKIRGFTLMELLVYLGVFSIASVFLTNILLTVTDITGRESASREVSSQLDATLETIQALIQQSSNIESASGSTLKLRMSAPASDPTCITLESGVIKIAQGPGTPADECSTTKTSLTTGSVVTNSLTFTKIDNIRYSEAEGRELVGHSVVNIDMSMTYNSTNPKYAISRTLTSAIGRVSAATFDSDLLPDTTNTRSIGTSALRWQNLNVNGTAYFAGNVGIGVSTPSQKLEINGNIKQGRMILWTGTIGNFALAANQVGYINFGDIAWNGQIEVELIGGWNHNTAFGALTRRFSFHHAVGGTSLSNYTTGVGDASGGLASNYAIGD